MKYLAFLIRLTILIIGISMVVQYGSGTPPFCSGVVFILIAVYLSVVAKYGLKAVSCLFNKCEGDSCCKK